MDAACCQLDAASSFDAKPDWALVRFCDSGAENYSPLNSAIRLLLARLADVRRKTKGRHDLRHFGLGALLLVVPVGIDFAQKLPKPARIWSVGPLTKSQPAMGIAFGAGGATLTGPRVDTQTSSTLATTRCRDMCCRHLLEIHQIYLNNYSTMS
jgi:hypothetical protein